MRGRAGGAGLHGGELEVLLEEEVPARGAQDDGRVGGDAAEVAVPQRRFPPRPSSTAPQRGRRS